MTVCIAAICADESGATAVVVAADRMQTVVLLEFENATTKIFDVTKTTVALLAGEARTGTPIIHAATAQVQPAWSCADIAQALSAHYAAHRLAWLEQQILGARGLTLATFYGGKQREISDHIATAIDGAILAYNYGAEILVAGVDVSGAHVAYIANPGGRSLDCDSGGFGVAGTGGPLATFTLLELGHAASSTIAETAFRVYAAKKRAESAQGVGALTDMRVIRTTGITALGSATMDQLAKLYDDHRMQTSLDLKGKSASLKLSP